MASGAPCAPEPKPMRVTAARRSPGFATDAVGPGKQAIAAAGGSTRAHSLRVRMLGTMFAVFALGLGASLATYRWSVDDVIEGLHEHTLENQVDHDVLVDSLYEEESEHALILIPFALLGTGLI